MQWRLGLVVSGLFLFSGATALVYQVAWTRNLSLIFGASHQAISIVLAAFMAGLALGGVVLGRMADRLARPLRTYGLLEAGIAVAGLLLPVLLALVDRIYVASALQIEGTDWVLNLLRVVCSFAVLLIPTFFMGGTLPVLTRYVVREAREFGPRLAWLYGINTFGAVVGALIAGFVLLPHIGVLRSQMLAVAANVVIAALAIFFDRRFVMGTADAAPPPVAPTPAVPAARAPGGALAAPTLARSAFDAWPLRLAFFGTFVSGFCALALEVMWTRGIGIAIGTTTYSFTIMLAAFLVGITLGSSLHAMVPLRRVHVALQFGVVLALIGISSAFVSQLVPRLPQIAVELNARLYGGAQGVRVMSTLLLSFAVMLVPATLMGIAFPLAGRARALLREQFGRSVGDTVGLNTLGGIFGPLVAGFVLIPHLGLQRGMLLVCGLNLGYGLLVVFVYGGARSDRRGFGAAAIAAGMAALALGMSLPRLLPTWDLHTMATFQNNVTLGYANAEGIIDVRGRLAAAQVLYYEEGRTSTVSVSEAQQSRAVLINGKSVATDYHSDLHHEYLLGHLPVLLHPTPRSALVIGLGAGLTLGGVTAHPEIETVTLVEIEEAVVGAARVFGDLNGNAVDNARVEIVLQDGRNYLKTTSRKFDVITADPIHPWAHGASYLYTTEYYALIGERLNPGGVMCQWMPLYELSATNLRSIAASFAANFEHNLLFQTAFDAVLIGSNQPIRLEMRVLAQRLRHDQVATQLARVGLDDAMSLLVELTMDDAAVRRFAEGGPINSDDNLYLEFSSPLSIGAPDGGGNIDLIDSYRTDPRSIVASWNGVFETDADVDRVLGEYMWAKRQTVSAAIQIEQAVALRSVDTWRTVVEFLRGVQARVPHYGRGRVELAQALTGLARELVSRGDREAAEAALREALEIVPDDAYANFGLGSLLLEAENPEWAVVYLRAALGQRARFPRGWQTLGHALMRSGRLDEALLAYERAVQTEPQNARAHLRIGN